MPFLEFGVCERICSEPHILVFFGCLSLVGTWQGVSGPRAGCEHAEASPRLVPHALPTASCMEGLASLLSSGWKDPFYFTLLVGVSEILWL